MYIQIREGESAGCKVAGGPSQKLGRRQHIPSKHLELEEGVRRMRARIQHQEALLQVLRPVELLEYALRAVQSLPGCARWHT